MDYISVKEAALKFNISERRVQKLCEENRIAGAKMFSNIWLIPETAQKPSDKRTIEPSKDSHYLNLKEICNALSISTATAKNWIKLGKLTPSCVTDGIPLFSHNYVQKLKEDIQNGTISSLKSRRNKKYISGNSIYKSYISPQSQNNYYVQSLVDMLKTSNELTEEIIRFYIAEAAIQLICQKKGIFTTTKASLLLAYIDGNISLSSYGQLIDELIDNKAYAKEYVLDHFESFCVSYLYEANEDILGLIYISLKNLGKRKSQGAYYTPTVIVKKLISHLNINNKDTKKILDPCCGTGNILLQLPENYNYTNIYGNDIDKTSVLITRINIALKFAITDYNYLNSHFTVSDYLSSSFSTYDYIIGNPPWGYEYSDAEKDFLRQNFSSAIGRNIESYDLFIEKAYSNLSTNGILAFVLPEAILNVKSHTPIRTFIMQRSSIRTIEYLGNAFEHVNCPCIILQTELDAIPFSTSGLQIISEASTFTIKTERNITPDYFCFETNDTEYNLLQKLLHNTTPCTTLRNRADFALGIVTGRNADYISNVRTASNEVILKGANIYKYKAMDSNNYITFTPERFQQVAPLHFYRAEEKILYRFISSQLVFAYDDKRTLSLNSCNIIIPHIDGLHIKYIIAILNSRIAQYIFSRCFNSIKVLRSHIEELPIPIADIHTQTQCIELVDKLISEHSSPQLELYYEQLDNIIAKLFNLTDSEYELIKHSLVGQNNFLY